MIERPPRRSAASSNSWRARTEFGEPFVGEIPLEIRGHVVGHEAFELGRRTGRFRNGRRCSAAACRATSAACRATPAACRATSAACRATPAACRATSAACRATPAACRATPAAFSALALAATSAFTLTFGAFGWRTFGGSGFSFSGRPLPSRPGSASMPSMHRLRPSARSRPRCPAVYSGPALPSRLPRIRSSEWPHRRRRATGLLTRRRLLLLPLNKTRRRALLNNMRRFVRH